MNPQDCDICTGSPYLCEECDQMDIVWSDYLSAQPMED